MFPLGVGRGKGGALVRKSSLEDLKDAYGPSLRGNWLYVFTPDHSLPVDTGDNSGPREEGGIVACIPSMNHPSSVVVRNNDRLDV